MQGASSVFQVVKLPKPKKRLGLGKPRGLKLLKTYTLCLPSTPTLRNIDLGRGGYISMFDNERDMPLPDSEPRCADWVEKGGLLG